MGSGVKGWWSQGVVGFKEVVGGQEGGRVRGWWGLLLDLHR